MEQRTALWAVLLISIAICSWTAAAQAQSRQVYVTDVILATCRLLQQQGVVSECEIDQNMFSTNYLDVTAQINPGEANTICALIATNVAQVSADQDAFWSGSAWQVRLHTPYTVRPLATCPIRFTHRAR